MVPLQVARTVPNASGMRLDTKENPYARKRGHWPRVPGFGLSGKKFRATDSWHQNSKPCSSWSHHFQCLFLYKLGWARRVTGADNQRTTWCLWNPVLWLLATRRWPNCLNQDSVSSRATRALGVASTASPPLGAAAYALHRALSQPVFTTTALWRSGSAAPSTDEDQDVLRGQGPCLLTRPPKSCSPRRRGHRQQGVAAGTHGTGCLCAQGAVSPSAFPHL